MKNIIEGNEEQKEQAEQFKCIICGNYPVPEFHLGREGVSKQSVKIG